MPLTFEPSFTTWKVFGGAFLYLILIITLWSCLVQGIITSTLHMSKMRLLLKYSPEGLMTCEWWDWPLAWLLGHLKWCYFDLVSSRPFFCFFNFFIFRDLHVYLAHLWNIKESILGACPEWHMPKYFFKLWSIIQM